MACQETTPMTSQKIPFLLYAPHHSAGYPGFQGLVPLARLSTACFRRLPFFNHRHCCHLKFAGRVFFYAVLLHSDACIIVLRFPLFPLVIPLYSFHYFPFRYLLMVLQFNPRWVFFDFLCAGSLLFFFFFRRALGRVKNERKEETNHIGRKRRHICLLFASGVFFVYCLLLLAIIVT